MLLTCIELIKSAPEMITFLTYPPLGCVKSPIESNQIQYPEYLHLSILTIFVNLTAPIRQFCKVTLESLVVGIDL